MATTITESDTVRQWIMAKSEVVDYGLRQYENQTTQIYVHDQYTPASWSDMQTMWRKTMVTMDMDIQTHKKWCATI
jgi:hypothetical protein